MTLQLCAIHASGIVLGLCHVTQRSKHHRE
jgi:hypothetical protein